MSASDDDKYNDGLERVTIDDLLATTRALACSRPLFHSEADFQHALAWKLHERWPDAHIRLESRPLPDERLYLDVWLRVGESTWAIELKCALKRFTAEVAGERFDLLDRRAQPILRYDFIRDIARLERITRHHVGAHGLALLLTNDPSLWQSGRRADTVDAAFRIHQGRILSGELAWDSHAGANTTKGRETTHVLSSTYALDWQEYSQVGDHRFRLLPVYVGAK